MTESDDQAGVHDASGLEDDDRPILVYGPWSARYDMGPSHPLTPRRFGPGIDLIRSVTQFATGSPIRELQPEPTPDAELRWSHTARYIEIVRRFSEAPLGGWEAGIGPGDTPAFAGMHDAAAAVAGGSIRAMEAILRGAASHAFHPGGGLHHAMPDRASGFCVYDDPALAIARARLDGLRVLYVDLDVHHGDGVQAIHAGDPGVLTFSIHQSGRTLFPGTGFVGELGDGAAAGTSLNLPLDPGTGERAWLAALRAVLPEVAAAFRPDIVVSQHGADAHAWDPLANLLVTTTAMGAAARLVDAIAHRWARGRWLSTGGGGYDVYRVVPRAWALVWLAALHVDDRPAVPVAWRERWTAEAERHGPTPLPVELEDEPNAGIRTDHAQRLADRRAGETAALVRELAVPALVRAAGDLGWRRALDDLELARGATQPHPGPFAAPTGAAPTIIDSVDAATWAGLQLADRVLPPGDAPTAHAIILAALMGPGAARLTTAVSDGRVVGAAVSANTERSRRLLALGIAPAQRGAGLGSEILRRHLSAHEEPGQGWDAAVTLAERDPVEPLPRATRAGIARRLLEDAGFSVERAAGAVGTADPGALVAHRAGGT